MTDKKAKTTKPAQPKAPAKTAAKPVVKKEQKPAAKQATKVIKTTKPEPTKKLVNAQIRSIVARVVENNNEKQAELVDKTKAQAKSAKPVAAVKKPAAKKITPQVQIKPKQVKDLSEQPQEVMDPKSVLEQLLKEAPVQDLMKAAHTPGESAEAPVVQKQEVGMQKVFQTHIDKETGLGGNRTYTETETSPVKKLSFADTLAKRAENKPKPRSSFNFPKVR